jgi:hypothetical protein
MNAAFGNHDGHVIITAFREQSILDIGQKNCRQASFLLMTFPSPVHKSNLKIKAKVNLKHSGFSMSTPQ